MNSLNDLVHRLRQSRAWIGAQFWAMFLLVLAGFAWTRLPDKHAWQVLLSLLVPLVLAACFLLLQAGTMRSLLGGDEKRTRFAVGALTLLVWAGVVWVAWIMLDWCDDQIPTWAGYLNSRASAHARATVFTYAHVVQWMTIAEWVLRWIVVPAKVIPHALASAQFGLRLPWRRVLRLLWNWRWWAAVILVALVGVALPAHLFTAEPHGSVSAQVWHVMLKLAGSYVLAASCWVLLLAWAAVLFGAQKPLGECKECEEIFKRLHRGRGWVVALFGWNLVAVLSGVFWRSMPSDRWWQSGFKAIVGTAVPITALILNTAFVRSLMGSEEKRVRMVWGLLSVLPWIALSFVITALSRYCHNEVAQWVLGMALASVLPLPFAAASAQWGLRVPWRRVISVMRNWRWWLAFLGAFLVGMALPKLLLAILTSESDSTHLWGFALKRCLTDLISTGTWVLLLSWLVVLFAQWQPSVSKARVVDSLLTAPPEGRQDKEG